MIAGVLDATTLKSLVEMDLGYRVCRGNVAAYLRLFERDGPGWWDVRLQRIASHRAALEARVEPGPRPDLTRVDRVRSSLGDFLYGSYPSSIEGVVGCSREFLVARFEELFEPGMTWRNYGRRGWHVGHVRPCASFDLADERQVLECFNWSNLKPQWASENLREGSLWNGVRWRHRASTPRTSSPQQS